MKKFLPIFLTLFLLGCSQTHIHSRAYDATFALFEEKDDDADFICTATAYKQLPDSYRLITAGHCIQKKPGFTYSVAKTIDGPRRTVTVVKAMREGGIDFAILELETTEIYTIVPLAQSYTEQIGDRVYSANFSEGMEEQVAEGLIASNVMSFPDDKYSDKRVVVHLFGGPGISGAAVVSERTQNIIGIITTGFHNVGLGLEPIDLFATFQHLTLHSNSDTIAPSDKHSQ